MINSLNLLQKLARLELNTQDVNAIQSSFDGLPNWTSFLNKAELYAISGLILNHVQQYDIRVPKAELFALKGLAMRHRAAANARYSLMQELSNALGESDIPFAALKGLALAPMIYPQDGLRPMRDIDILVPREQEQKAADVLRGIGFHLPDTQPSKFMRDSHQLPNATKRVNGFTISVEIHHDALSRDVHGHLFYEDVTPHLQRVSWRELEFKTLGHEQMLHQVSKHLEGLHPGAVLKLINVMDVVLYAEQYIDEINWDELRSNSSHVLNTLKCLHMIHPLSAQLQLKISGTPLDQKELADVGMIMLPLTHIISKQNTVLKQLKLLFAPSDWWLHLYYNVDPNKSLWLVKCLRHPLTIAVWIGKRLFSRVLGG
jgi:hypothetical protein